MTQKRNKVALNVYVNPELAERLDRFVVAQPLAPSKTAMVEVALARLLDELEGKPTPSIAVRNKKARH